MSDIYECTMTVAESRTLENMRKKLAKDFGVTLQGNRLTLRWNMGAELVQVETVILRTSDGDRNEEEISQ